ncbi:MAG: chain length determinant protein tyrosine kinase EpsG [Proteobacteria bacterium]|nr:MAG: chain length determinant protein tyrosine kinase EpsG [Pseudomonadota bacterium]
MVTNPQRSTRIRDVTAIKKPIGELLCASGALTEGDVRRVIEEQRRTGGLFGQTALRMGLITEDALQRALAVQYGYPYVDEGQSTLAPTLAAAYRPFGEQAETYRRLRTELSLRWFSEDMKALAICGVHRHAGCSTLVANLAVTFAQLGRRTLLIGADLRRPRLHQLFGLTQETGLAELLAGHSLIDKAVTSPHPFDRLYLLCSGVIPPNPHELLSKHTFHWLLEAARERFDAILIDAPPVLEYPDAQMVAARAGACLIVTRRHVTRIADVLTAKSLLAPTGAALLGTVIND